MTYRSHIAKIEHTWNGSQTFDHKDSRGRTIGAVASLDRYTVVDAPADAISANVGYPHAGTYYHAEVQATRDGKRYGASQGGKTFEDETAALGYISERFAASEKAAAKKALKS